MAFSLSFPDDYDHTPPKVEAVLKALNLDAHSQTPAPAVELTPDEAAERFPVHAIPTMLTPAKYDTKSLLEPLPW